MDQVIRLIDETLEKQQPDQRRAHLGASVIGDTCARKIFFGYRWATEEKLEGRIIRLFRRGQAEEDIVFADLEAAGMKVINRQTNVKPIGHVGGSIDGMVFFGEDPMMVEIKTHNLKSFTALKKDSVKKAKPMHYAQMLTYMYMTGQTGCVYIAVCKDNDELYFEHVGCDSAQAEFLVERANDIAMSEVLPPRISDTPMWFECKFCPHSDVCHKGAAPAVSCRTCAYAKPTADGQWHCRHWDKGIPFEAQKKGCGQYRPMADLATDDEELREIIRAFDAKIIED